MPVKILLISINRCRNPYPVFPLGISHITGALRKNGFDVKVIDMGFQDRDLEPVLRDFNPDYVGLSLRNIDDVRIDKTQFFVPELCETVKRVKDVSGAGLILGGSAFSLFPEELLEMTGADYGLMGEAEGSIITLLEVLSGSHGESLSALEKVPGLIYRQGNIVRKNAPAAFPSSEISIPCRIPEIAGYYLKSSGMLNIQTQRGCPFTCCYCTYPLIEGKRARFRPARSVAEDVEDAVRSGAEYLFIVDSAFNTSNDHVAGICEEFLKLKVKFEWGCFLRPCNLTQDLMALMARAGLKHIEFGSDSFCDSVLESYGKNFTFDDILSSSEMARKEKIHYSHFLIVGGPGETEDTLRKSFENSTMLKKTVIFPFTGMRIYPGTPLYAHALKEKYISEPVNLLEPLFYISPYLTKERIAGILSEFHQRSCRWAVEDITPEQAKVMESLRERGIKGPLWEFLAG